MYRQKRLAFGLLAVLALTAGQAAAQIEYVIQISVDGGGSSYIQNLINLNQLPNFKKMQNEGAWTNNARTDYDYTETLPNHTTMVTARGVFGVGGNGHGWKDNGTPTTTIHLNKGYYVHSVFDVAHNNGLRTGMYAGKSKFSLFDTSYNATNGGVDLIPPDNGKDKLDTYLYLNSNSAGLMTSFTSTMTGPNPLNFAFFHYTETDGTGHSSGWGSTAYNDALKTMDGYLGQMFNMIATDPDLTGKTAIILTADHGGTGTGHGTASNALNYTIPFYVWGPGVTAGADLYDLNPLTRLDPGTGRPVYTATGEGQPIRNGDAVNLALDLLGLDAILGSTINSAQDLAVPEPASMGLLALGGLALLRRRRSPELAEGLRRRRKAA